MEIGSSESQSECNLSIKLGLEFDWDEHAYDYYNEYSSAIGFSIRKEYANKNKAQGYVNSRKFTCYKEGYRNKIKQDMVVQKHRQETRTGCLAHIIINRQSNEMFHITSFEEKHNHPLVSPSLAHLLPSQRKIKVAQAYEIDLLDDSGIRPKASFDYAARQVGGESFLGYTKRDQKNYLRDKRKESLKHGVARSLVDYFEKRILEDLAFRHPLKILDTLNIKDRIPIQYILKRWTKDVTNINEMDAILEEKDIDPKVEVTARYRHLCHTFVQISSSASESKEGYELVVNGVNEMIAKLKDIKKRKESPDKSAPSNTTQNEPSEILSIY
ncbi:hypothetical protein MTR67_004314 [Solanum verrucosum]|uniref:FAR1 domain-containing protein n=1 Tax=Solanum verrucosum TaxID=315347 RepID=A0AAF0TAG0_SOLVR|nr:hypothetical protein MTR67_004314 [Solanum verrucosum]